MVERALLLNRLDNQDTLESFSRLYLGAEHCPHLLPEPAELRAAADYCREQGVSLTLVTSLCYEATLEKQRRLIETCASLDNCQEIVVNDWGIFHYVTSTFPHLQPVIGRLLTRQKRFGQRLDLSEKECTHFTTLPLSHPRILKWLRSRGVKRIELEVDEALDVASLVETKTSISLYLPYNIVSVTRACAASYLNKSGWQNLHECATLCLDSVVYLSNDEHHGPLVVKGCARFSASQPLEENDCQADRLVFGDVC